MIQLTQGIHLYHGSYAPIESINLDLCAEGKDFGKGFYLSSDKEQARKFIATSLKKAQNLGVVDNAVNFGYVSEFCFVQRAELLEIEILSSANIEWLQFVSANRRGDLAERFSHLIRPKLFTADVVIGKIANDRTNPTITAYLNGLYGDITDLSSAEIAIGLLLPNKLEDQYCFRTQKAVSCLEVVVVTRYEL